MRSVLMLIDKLQNIGIEVSEQDFVRTRAGRNMLSGGTFSWFFMKSNNGKSVGSIYTVKELIKNNTELEILENDHGGIEIFPKKII